MILNYNTTKQPNFIGEVHNYFNALESFLNHSCYIKFKCI